MYRVTFVSALFSSRRMAEQSGAVLSVMLEALTQIDELWLRAHPETPALYSSGVRYQPEPLGQENWQDVATTLGRRVGDCEDLATWRAAELRVREGIPARAVFRSRFLPVPKLTLYHILVQYPDGTIEDPSKRLGMGQTTENQAWTSAP